MVGGAPCLRLDSWGSKTGLVFANNAVYCTDANYAINGVTGVTVAGNVFDTAPPSLPSSGYKLGHAATVDLTNLTARNVYPTPTSTLIGAAVADSGGGGGVLDPLLLAVIGGMTWVAVRRRMPSHVKSM